MKPVNVLIIDDEPLARDVIQSHVDKIPNWHVVAQCMNAEEAYEALLNHTIDVIFLDIQMPVMDGIQATEEIRKSHDKNSLPILALTANALPGDRERYIAAGMNDYIPKPIDFEKLQNKLMYWGKKKQRVA